MTVKQACQEILGDQCKVTKTQKYRDDDLLPQYECHNNIGSRTMDGYIVYIESKDHLCTWIPKQMVDSKLNK